MNSWNQPAPAKQGREGGKRKKEKMNKQCKLQKNT